MCNLLFFVFVLFFVVESLQDTLILVGNISSVMHSLFIFSTSCLRTCSENRTEAEKLNICKFSGDGEGKISTLADSIGQLLFISE